jgi:hypothetical protein
MIFGPRGITNLVLLGLLACRASAASSRAATQNRAQQQGLVRSGRRASGFVKSLGFKHRLRVCNAYPYASALEILLGKSQRLTENEPMPYKSCRDMTYALKAGDKLEFKIGDATAGTFSVNDVPNNDATLFLVVHRHDTLSTAVAFESHVFSNLANPQVAIIDTYKGKARATPRIKDAEVSQSARSERSEALRYNSVVAVNPGLYDVELDGDDGASLATSQLVALNRESYVVLRTGVEAQQGESYPQSLVVFPRSDSTALQKPSIVHSGAAVAGGLRVTIMAVAMLAFIGLGRA